MTTLSLSVFFRDLANMIESGIPLRASLETLADTSVGKEWRPVCQGMKGALEEGASLREVFLNTRVFPREVMSVIAAGERAGRLASSLTLLAEYFEVRAEIQRKVGAALVYPAVVMVLLTGVFLYMALDVIPRVSVFLPAGSLDGTLTAGLLRAACFLRGNVPAVAVAGGIIIFVTVTLMMRFREKVRRWMTGLPLVGALIRERELALSFFTLMILQKSGVPLDVSLSEAGHVAGGMAAGRWEQCRAFVAGGLTLSEALRRDPYFPKVAADTLRVGEESGRFGEYFERVFRYFYRAYQQRLERIVAAVRPALLLVAGGFIALIGIAFLQPLYGNLSGIGGF